MDLATLIDKTGSTRFTLIPKDHSVVGSMLTIVGEIDCVRLSSVVKSLCSKFFSLPDVQAMSAI